MVNINSEVIVERIQKDGVNTIIITAVIAILSWIFNMYHKSANKYRDQKDQQFREARATFESALKQINKDDTDFNEFYDLLKYTKTTEEYYQLINDKNEVEIKKYITGRIFELNDKNPTPFNESEFAYKIILGKIRYLRIYENIVVPTLYTLFTVIVITIAIGLVLNINNNPLGCLVLANILISAIFFVTYGSLLLDDDKVFLSSSLVKILVILEFVAATTVEYNQKFGNAFALFVNVCFFITTVVSAHLNNVKNITRILNKKSKLRGYNMIMSFVKSQNGELLSDEKLVSFIYFFNHKIYGIYQFKKIENNKLVLVKEIRKSYYDSIIDQKKVFSEIEENSKCKIIQ